MGNIEKFDAIANCYDTYERLQTTKIIVEKIKKYIGNKKNSVAMDFGCGTGLIGMQLIDNFSSMIFIDASYSMIEQVNEKIRENKISSAKTICYNFEEHEDINIKSDYIIIVQTLLHIKDIELILSRLFKILNNNGHLIIVDFNKNDFITSNEVHNGFDQNELGKILKNIGYDDVKSETFYFGENIFMGNDASLFILDCKK